MNNIDISRLASLAEAIVEEPTSVSKFIDITLDSNVHHPISQELNEAITILHIALKQQCDILDLFSLLDIAFKLEKDNGLGKVVGTSLRWAIYNNNLSKQRKHGCLDKTLQEYYLRCRQEKR